MTGSTLRFPIVTWDISGPEPRGFGCAPLARSFLWNSWQPLLHLRKMPTSFLHTPGTVSPIIGQPNGSRRPSSTTTPCQRNSTASPDAVPLHHVTLQHGCRSPVDEACVFSSRSCAPAVDDCLFCFWLRALLWPSPWTTVTAGTWLFLDIRQ